MAKFHFGFIASRVEDCPPPWKLVVYVKTQFAAVGLDLATFDFEDVDKPVIPVVNELVYDTISECIESDSNAELHFVAIDSPTERDDKRAILDLVNGCIALGVRL
ncbi:hypothetical protein CYMTET_45939 [Cymbomonas tetramitiformis]|uniref:Uncharacterized protein n=1 Tax=Cymbomonas tetramitiformis TaxID=36881 RepID=A0AAE0BYZ9_9CHLO|nr:hypothetical protein CYMTET_45939 [Cymbomonas tetramitiformis]